MSRFELRLSIAVSAIALACSAAHADVITDWNATALAATEPLSPQAEYRAPAMTQAAMFDAVNAFDCGDGDWSSRILLAARDCPEGEDCGPWEPPEPPDPENPPPQPPMPPPPEIVRTVTVPADFIVGQISVALAGTVLQVSHTDGDPLSFWGMVERCESAPNPGPEECLDRCSGVPPNKRGKCMTDCRDRNQVCRLQCGSHPSLSYLQWGLGAKTFSRKERCDTTTCPACAQPTDVPSLRDVELPVKVFHREWDPWPLPKVSVTCKINRFQFRAQADSETGQRFQVNVSADGLTVNIPGTTGSPAIRCDGAPDVYVENPSLKLSLRTARDGFTVTAKAELGGTFSISVIRDLFIDEAIKEKFTEVAGNRLNASDKRALFLSLLRGLTDKYIEQNHLDPRVGEVRRITFSDAGMTVVYLMAPW